MLRIKIEHEEPVELLALTGSLQALGRRWTRTRRRVESADEDELKLFVRTIKEGSIIVDLTTMASYLPPVLAASAVSVASDPAKALDVANGAADFITNLKRVTDYFLKRGPKPDGLSVRDCDEAAAIAAPIINQSSGGIAISTGDNSPVNITLNINQLEGNMIQNRARIEKEALKEPSFAPLIDVVFVWHQADIKDGRETGSSPDKGLIEAVSDKPQSVFFPNPNLKRQMIEAEENPFARYWLVDADVLAVNGKVTGYKITAIKGRGDISD